jgi:hypothetical protein
MLRIFFSFAILLFTGLSLQAQHFDELYNRQMGQAKTWRDSGYYFMPNLVRFKILGPASGPQNVVAVDVNFQSTDNSGLMFSGQATFLLRPSTLPPDVTLAGQSQGLAIIMLPLDLLFCPDAAQEQGMGQDDPYFPLFLAGGFSRIGTQWLETPVSIMVQLNDFVVN